MRVVFQQELAEVETELVALARLVHESIEKATRAFATADVALAEEVMTSDQNIDERAIALDELAIEIIARQAPVARDLRTVISALRISASLERMGDIAAHIAQLARLRFPETAGPSALRDSFIEMGKRDVEIAEKLVRLLETQDNEIAEDIKRSDDAIDEIHKSIFDALLTRAEEEGARSVQVVDATLASRYHERFADHAVSIALKIQYLTSGEWIQDKEAADN